MTNAEIAVSTSGISLPPLEPYEVTPSSKYGSETIAARYCGMRRVPDHFRGQWQHGWDPECSNMIPEILICDVPHQNKRDYFWVARTDQETTLRKYGYPNALAIGLPLVYCSATPAKRVPGSLLVMPVHTLEYTTQSCNFDAYVDAIDSIRGEFSRVVVCIHPACWEAGYWVGAFQDRGFDVVQGASYKDRNGLQRIRTLLSHFEYVTTNGFGSHLAYAAYLGAKMSIYGPFAEPRMADFAHHSLLKNNPRLAHDLFATASEANIKRHFPQLFCAHPRAAEAHLEWGAQQVGQDNKVSPSELRRLFGWDLIGRFRSSLGRARVSLTGVSKLIKGAVPEPIKHWRRLVVNQEYKERERLKILPPDSPTVTALFGKRLAVTNPRAFLAEVDTIFNRQIYRFTTASSTPLIIDGSPGIGLSTIYFKREHPQSRVLAFEHDADAFAALRVNCEEFALMDVEVAPKKLSTENTVLKARHKSAGVRGILANGQTNAVLEIQTMRLRDLLHEPVDLLKLNLADDEVKVIEDCLDVLGKVAHIVLHYRSLIDKPQCLAALLGFLEQGGFRVHTESPSPAPSPLYQRLIDQKSDLQLTIFAFRS